MNPLPPDAARTADGGHYRSKTLAAWLALLAGTLGLHRFYLHGLRDAWGWLHLPPTALGLLGVLRLREQGQDDRLAWLLLPLLGVMITVATLTAIVHALTPDEKWDAQHNPGRPGPATGWGPVLAAVASLMLGGIAATGTVAYGGQKFFEWQMGSAQAQNSSMLRPQHTPAISAVAGIVISQAATM